MTKLMRDIRNQPEELRSSLAFSTGTGRKEIERAAEIVDGARHVYLTGIGSSWHAGMAIESLFVRSGRPVHLVDASELIAFHRIPPDSAAVVLSRSGRSVEIVRLIEQSKLSGMRLVGITNTPESPLAKEADVSLSMHAAFDHNVSITMYSALNLVGGLLAETVLGGLDEELVRSLDRALLESGASLDGWIEQAAKDEWLSTDRSPYFLARGGSLATCHEAELLWEEAAKMPATAMTTGGFRHGPQEVVEEGMRVALWLDPEERKERDLELAADLRRHGAKVWMVGQSVPSGSADRTISLPAIPARWQFLIDIIPAQVAVERLARMRGVDCDEFRLCPYIIKTEGGLA